MSESAADVWLKVSANVFTIVQVARRNVYAQNVPSTWIK